MSDIKNNNELEEIIDALSKGHELEIKHNGIVYTEEVIKGDNDFYEITIYKFETSDSCGIKIYNKKCQEKLTTDQLVYMIKTIAENEPIYDGLTLYQYYSTLDKNEVYVY